MGLFSRSGTRRPAEAPAAGGAVARVETESLGATKAFPKFIASLAALEAPVLVDVGPVIGSNVAYFGERLGCKIHIADLYAELERHAREGSLDHLAESVRKRLALPDASVDGVLCWDLLDYLSRDHAQAVAAELTRVLRVNGALLGFFHPAPERDPFFVRYIVVDETTLRHRPYAGTRVRQGGLQNRDVIRMFDGLRVSDSFLLKTNVREIVFRKPSYLAAGLAGRRI